MPLTPTDVANKQFRIAFRGYSLDEVDAFLDEVETELTRLLRDNAALQDRPAAAAPQATAAAPAAPAAAPVAPLGGMEGQEAALRTLLLAQRTADEAIAEARAEAEQIVTAAREQAETTVGSARAEADKTLTSARSEAERTLSAAQHKAASIDADVAARIQAATGDLDTRRRELEQRIEELRAFEREYRTRLKAYLESQLRDLDTGSTPDDGGSGVPAGARSAAVAGTAG
ncbi:MAG: DivIVA family protein, partial [Frankiales bacterium]|nr:DivIVA family protein [Frankiales bacterium]